MEWNSDDINGQMSVVILMRTIKGNIIEAVFDIYNAFIRFSGSNGCGKCLEVMVVGDAT